MNKQKIKNEARSLVRNAASFGYRIKHGHALEIVSRMRGAGNYQTVAGTQPVALNGDPLDSHSGSFVDDEQVRQPLIIMTSLDTGGEMFKYEDEDAREGGFVRLVHSTQAVGDGVARSFYFSTHKSDDDDAGDLVAKWDGVRWAFLSTAVDLSNHDLFLCGECGKICDIDDSCSHDEGLICATCKATMNVDACDATELINTLGLDRGDIEFWVLQTFQRIFESASNEQKEQWVHQYRQRWYGNA